MSNPTVTIYIPCRNYGKYLSQAVESIYAQLCGSWELYLVDEGSLDGTGEACREYAKRDPSRVFAIINENPVGLQKVANDILSKARGKYILRLDADDWLHESALLLMIAKLEKHPSKNICFGDYHYTDKTGKVIGTEKRRIFDSRGSVGHAVPHGACTLIRTRALRAVGGYNESVNAQDGWDIWLKMGGSDAAVMLDLPLFYYRQHGSSLSRNSDRLLSAREAIFKDLASKSDGDYKLKNVIVIPVRENYPGFQGVPFKKFRNKSLLQHAIESVTCSKHVSEIVVSSTSEKVINFAEELENEGLVTKHLRLKRETAEDEISNEFIVDVLLGAGGLFYERNECFPDTVSFASMHAVGRQPSHVEAALNVLRLTKSDTVVSVQQEREPIFNYGAEGLELLNPGRFQNLDFHSERLFKFNGAVISTWWELIEMDILFGSQINYVEMSLEDSKQIKSAADIVE